jgi:hypothetical protein
VRFIYAQSRETGVNVRKEVSIFKRGRISGCAWCCQTGRALQEISSSVVGGGGCRAGVLELEGELRLFWAKGGCRRLKEGFSQLNGQMQS